MGNKNTMEKRNRFDVIAINMLIPIILIEILCIVGALWGAGAVLVEVGNNMDVPGIQWLIFLLGLISPFFLVYMLYNCVKLMLELAAIILFIKRCWKAYEIIGFIHFILIFLESIVICPLLIVLLFMISPILPSEGVGTAIIVFVWVSVVLAIIIWFLYLVVLGVMCISAMISRHDAKKHYSASACRRPDSCVTRK